MRPPIVIEFVTLDGVVQAPDGPDEDTSGGFAHGGWVRPYADPVQSAVIRLQMRLPFDRLLGRRTFEIWARYWPQYPDVWPGVQTATKYVASSTMTSHAWGPSVFLGGDVAGQVAKLKRQPGADLHVYGSANLLQTLRACGRGRDRELLTPCARPLCSNCSRRRARARTSAPLGPRSRGSTWRHGRQRRDEWSRSM